MWRASSIYCLIVGVMVAVIVILDVYENAASSDINFFRYCLLFRLLGFTSSSEYT